MAARSSNGLPALIKSTGRTPIQLNWQSRKVPVDCLVESAVLAERIVDVIFVLISLVG
ncbi:MAG: hypothetical protein ACI87E_002950 [Mariniblastus sp.]|jgi:hypothetical protein